VRVGFVSGIPVAALLISVACGTGGGSPAAPSLGDVAVLGTEAQGRTSLCHGTEGTSAFTPVSIADPSVQTHEAHGDLRPGDAVPGVADMKLSSICTVVPSDAVVLTFDGPTGPVSPFAAYSQDGFTVTPILGDWVTWTSYGHPAPAIVFTTSADTLGIGAVRVSASGATFQFHAVDVYSSITPIPWEFTGFRDSSQVFAVSGQQGNTFGAFVPVDNSMADAIDTLTIQLTNPIVSCCPNAMGLDNIVVSYAP